VATHLENLEKVMGFDIGQGKVREIVKSRESVVCLWRAAAVAIFTK